MKRAKHQRRKARRGGAAAIQRPGIAWGTLLLTLLCAAVMAAGFFLAAIQHFATINLGFMNSNLRQQVEDLQAENRRLLLAREISLSPAEITKTAERLGFREEEPVMIAETASLTEVPKPTEVPQPAAEKRPEGKPASISPPAREREFAKTVASAPVRERRPEPSNEKAVIVPPARDPDAIGGRPRRVSEEPKSLKTVTAVAKLK